MNESSGLDVVIRLYDPSELPRLDHCVFSLLGQSLEGFGVCEPLRLHLMLWHFSWQELQAVRAATQPLRQLNDTASFTFHNWELQAPFDVSVALLNWGLAVTSARYFTVLDTATVLLPGAYARLLARLRSTQAVMAVGGVAPQPVLWWGDVVLPVPTSSRQPGAEVAIPQVFLIDRVRVPVQNLVFRLDESPSEISHFISRLNANYPTDMLHATDLLGLYQLPRG